jgi:hypothetical protein
MLLAGFFGDFQTALANDCAGVRAFSGELEAWLTKIVGKDLGSNAQAWTTWYTERNRTKAREAVPVVAPTNCVRHPLHTGHSQTPGIINSMIARN